MSGDIGGSGWDGPGFIRIGEVEVEVEIGSEGMAMNGDMLPCPG